MCLGGARASCRCLSLGLQSKPQVEDLCARDLLGSDSSMWEVWEASRAGGHCGFLGAQPREAGPCLRLVRGGHRRENRGTDPATSIPGSGLFPPAPATCPVPCGQSPLLGSEKPSVGRGRCRRQAAGRVSGPCPHARRPPAGAEGPPCAGCCSRPARGRGRERKPDPARPPRSALLGHGRVALPAEPRLPCCNERRHASPADGACAS